MVAARKTKEETVRLAKLWKKQNFMPESEKTLRAILRLDEKEFEKHITQYIHRGGVVHVKGRFAPHF